MALQTQIEQSAGFTGKWNEARDVFRVDAQTYGYLSPIQRIEIEGGGEGIRIVSGALTNTEWWHWFMPVTSCPRYKGTLVEIADRYDPFCKAAACTEACGAEDGFVDLSAGRLRLVEEAKLIENIFPRLQAYLQRAERLTDQICADQNVGILIDSSQSVVSLHSRVKPDPASFNSHVQAIKELYPVITGVQGKVNTAFLPQPKEYSQDDLEEASVLEEARYHALVEAVRQEAIDILHFLVAKKGGTVEDDVFHLAQDNMSYIMHSNRIEAQRNSLYMGNEGFKKGVQELQKFFQTTLGGGRW
ncbi:MAG: hypothetical protein CVV27_12490 [Candidatus Melainabacteria bacterium HGW-Melainabacteria-1]|nr:MAG: hypothetical protein CVV27_12490 [Candidatus Melainabacteria bacterium HGW-Melainabacteria-1]